MVVMRRLRFLLLLFPSFVVFISRESIGSKLPACQNQPRLTHTVLQHSVHASSQSQNTKQFSCASKLCRCKPTGKPSRTEQYSYIPHFTSSSPSALSFQPKKLLRRNIRFCYFLINTLCFPPQRECVAILNTSKRKQKIYIYYFPFKTLMKIS
jgi:hypothetical protein